jgi:diketogulonate reductase-like aldo/keto reductase
MVELMPSVGFGTYKLIKGDEAFSSIRCALDNGYRHFDTASLYKTEEDIGKALLEARVPRDNIWITSKVHGSYISKVVNKI